MSSDCHKVGHFISQCHVWFICMLSNGATPYHAYNKGCRIETWSHGKNCTLSVDMKEAYCVVSWHWTLWSEWKTSRNMEEIYFIAGSLILYRVGTLGVVYIEKINLTWQFYSFSFDSHFGTVFGMLFICSNCSLHSQPRQRMCFMFVYTAGYFRPFLRNKPAFHNLLIIIESNCMSIMVGRFIM